LLVEARAARDVRDLALSSNGTPRVNDMAPTKKSPKVAKKEKIFHPESRKAEQLARKQLRKTKLAGQASKRAKLHSVRGKCRS
jgi:hypothetical protein